MMKDEPVTTLKRQATKEPILIAEHGQPSSYLVDVDDYEFRQRRTEILEGIARGEKAIPEERTLSQEQARAKTHKWLK